MKIKTNKILKSLIAIILAVFMIVGTTATGLAKELSEFSDEKANMDISQTGWRQFNLIGDMTNWNSGGEAISNCWNNVNGKYYIRKYWKNGQYFALYSQGLRYSPDHDADTGIGNIGQAVYSKNTSWKYTGPDGYVNLCIDQTGEEHYPYIWLEYVSIPDAYFPHTGDWSVTADKNKFTGDPSNVKDDGIITYSMNIAKSSAFQFKVYYNGEYYGAKNTTITSSACTGIQLSTSGDNVNLTPVAYDGYYTFKFNINTKKIDVVYPKEAQTMPAGSRVYFYVNGQSYWDYEGSVFYARFNDDPNTDTKMTWMLNTGSDATTGLWHVDIPEGVKASSMRVLRCKADKSQIYNTTENKYFKSKNLNEIVLYVNGQSGTDVSTTFNMPPSGAEKSAKGNIYFDNQLTKWDPNKIYMVVFGGSAVKAWKMDRQDTSNIYYESALDWDSAKGFMVCTSDENIDGKEYSNGLGDFIDNHVKECTTVYEGYSLNNNGTYLLSTSARAFTEEGKYNPYALKTQYDDSSIGLGYTGYNFINYKVNLQVQKKNASGTYVNDSTVATPMISSCAAMTANGVCGEHSAKTGVNGKATQDYVLTSSSVTLGYKNLLSGYTFDGYFDEKGNQISDTVSSSANDMEVNLYARFSETKYNVIVNAGNGGMVTVGSETGESVSATVSANPNNQTTITATPTSGYSFVGWTSKNGKVVFADKSSAQTTIYAMEGDEITANFEKTQADGDVTIYFKSSDSYGYIPKLTINGDSVVMNKQDTYIAQNKTQSQSYYWYKCVYTYDEAETLDINIQNNRTNSDGSGMNANITISTTELPSTGIYLAVDNMNNGTEVVDLTSETEIIRNLCQSATNMVVPVYLVSSGALYTNLNGTPCVLGDVDNDGVNSICDVTAQQKSLAHLITLDEKSMKLSDFNLDGESNIVDATKQQRYLADLQ